MEEFSDVIKSTHIGKIKSYLECLDCVIIMMEKRDVPCTDLLDEQQQLLDRIKKLENI